MTGPNVIFLVKPITSEKSSGRAAFSIFEQPRERKQSLPQRDEFVLDGAWRQYYWGQVQRPFCIRRLQCGRKASGNGERNAPTQWLLCAERVRKGRFECGGQH